MNTLDRDYISLLTDIIYNGTLKEGRNGSTKSVFGRMIRHDMKSGFPILTTKKIHFSGVVTELLWFLQGRTDLRYLLDNNCTIWVGDALKVYNRGVIDDSCELSDIDFIHKIKTDDHFSEIHGGLGKIYGHQWRNFCGTDQLIDVFDQLRNSPDSRRMMVSAWNPSELNEMILPPCHYSYQFYTRPLSYGERYRVWFDNNKPVRQYDDTESIDFEDDIWSIKTPTRGISLLWNQRSVDVPLGLPYNITSYGLLLHIVAKCFNMVPDELIGSLGDCHIYTNQMNGIAQQLTRDPYPLPKLQHLKTDAFYESLSTDLTLLSHIDKKDFRLIDYISHPKISIPLSN